MSTSSTKWQTPLTIWVSGLLIFELISGLIIYLGAFTLTSQETVLFHTAFGMLLVIPYCLYQFRHWKTYWNHKVTHHKLTGYFSMASTLCAALSGLLLTYEAVFGDRINYTVDQIHVVSTFAFMLTALPHIGLILFRDIRALWNKKSHALVRSEKSFAIRVILVLMIPIGAVVLFGFAYEPVHFNNRFPANYQFSYGKNKPFEPSLATTSTGEAIDARLLGGSASCMSSGCHSNIGTEWEADAHRYSAMDPAFRIVQHNMAVEKGPASTRYCGGCHDPISLLSGSKNLDDKALTNPIGLNEGISCVSCHSVTKVDVKGNAEYQITPPVPYIFELKKGKTAKWLSDFLIRAYPKHHVSTYNRELLKTPEFCGSCHKQFINKQVNGVGWVQLQNQYDNWRKSHWNHPGNPMKTIECRECHMPLLASYDPANGDNLDYNRTPTDGKHRSHRFLGGNQFMPTLLKLPDGKLQVKLINEWLKGQIDIPEIKNKWHSGTAIPIQIICPSSIVPGQQLTVAVTLTNNKTGHNFPTGPLDLIQAWIRLTVKDHFGHLIYASGVLDQQHFIPPGSYIYRAEPVDEDGNLIDKHNLWQLVGVKFNRALYPGFSDQVKYDIPYQTYAHQDLNNDTLIVHAELCYRKFNQFVINKFFSDGKNDITAPVSVLSSDVRRILVHRSTTHL